MKLKHNIPFPLAINGQWHDSQALTCPCPRLQDWLLNTGSLTERLESQTRRFEVQVLGQGICAVEPEEAACVKPGARELVVRETLLTGEGRPWVFARSLMLPALCEANNQQLALLGNQPLGKVIFNDSRFERQAFQTTCLPEDNLLCRQLGLEPRHSLWGRRSVFKFQDLRLMVAEIFLPESPAYAGLPQLREATSDN